MTWWTSAEPSAELGACACRESDAGDFGPAGMERYASFRNRGKPTLNDQRRSFKAGEAIRNADEPLPGRAQILQPLFRPRSRNRLTQATTLREATGFSRMLPARHTCDYQYMGLLRVECAANLHNGEPGKVRNSNLEAGGPVAGPIGEELGIRRSAGGH